MMSKSTSRISMAIISAISTGFAFPFFCFFLVRRIFALPIMRLIGRGSPLRTPFEYGLTLSLFAPFVGFFVFLLVYHALKYRNANKIQMSRKAQAIIALSAGFLTVITFEGTTPISGVSGLLLTAVLCLNFFFSSMIVLSSLYYATR